MLTRRQTDVRVLIASALIGLCVTACSASHQSARSTQPRRPVTGQASIAPTRDGTITGRYYADGGPIPLGYQPARPIVGTITVTNAQSHQVYRARQDSGGYFTVVVPVGTYEVVARSGNIAGAMTKIVTVRADKTADADLGIHMG